MTRTRAGRCRSWRHHDVHGHDGHSPSQCRRCWTTCHNRLSGEDRAAGARRCGPCTDALLLASDPEVRLLLAAEDGQTQDVLGALATDPDGRVAAAARDRLARTLPVARPPAAARRKDDLWPA